MLEWLTSLRKTALLVAITRLSVGLVNGWNSAKSLVHLASSGHVSTSLPQLALTLTAAMVGVFFAPAFYFLLWRDRPTLRLSSGLRILCLAATVVGLWGLFRQTVSLADLFGPGIAVPGLTGQFRLTGLALLLPVLSILGTAANTLFLIALVRERPASGVSGVQEPLLVLSRLLLGWVVAFAAYSALQNGYQYLIFATVRHVDYWPSPSENAIVLAFATLSNLFTGVPYLVVHRNASRPAPEARVIESRA